MQNVIPMPMQLDRELQGQVPPLQCTTGRKWPREEPDMFPTSNCSRYISTPHASVGQAFSATLQAVRKDWQSLPSSSMASLSISCICSTCDCCRMQVHSKQVASATLIAAAHAASAFQIVVAQWALTSLRASAVWDGLILMKGDFGVQYLLSVMGIYGCPGCK